MIRPIPIFRFAFAAYYATLDWEWLCIPSEALGSAPRQKPSGAHLALVVDNTVSLKPRPRARSVKARKRD